MKIRKHMDEKKMFANVTEIPHGNIPLLWL